MSEPTPEQAASPAYWAEQLAEALERSATTCRRVAAKQPSWPEVRDCYAAAAECTATAFRMFTRFARGAL